MDIRLALKKMERAGQICGVFALCSYVMFLIHRKYMAPPHGPRESAEEELLSGVARIDCGLCATVAGSFSRIVNSEEV